ncbi:hypothetical protein HYX17_03040 [Candidatus Woesearchaeota archaeon]|nr:hypothetical protein [Candidatus Woesearchaeota archaeon]
MKVELTRRLIGSIDEFNISSSKESKMMRKLSQRMMWFTIIVGSLTLIQVVILIKQTFYT